MPAKPVVVNSTPLVAFWSIGRLNILRRLFGEIMIPPAVRIDERKARRYAERLKLPLSGTLGVLLLAKEEKIISAVSPLLKAIQDAGLYLHADLVRQVLKIAGEK